MRLLPTTRHSNPQECTAIALQPWKAQRQLLVPGCSFHGWSMGFLPFLSRPAPRHKPLLGFWCLSFPLHLTVAVYHHPADLGRRMDKLPGVWGSANTHSSFFAKITQVHKGLSLQSQTPDQAAWFCLFVCFLLSERVRCVFSLCTSWAGRRGLSGHEVSHPTSGSLLYYIFSLSLLFVISLSAGYLKSWKLIWAC